MDSDPSDLANIDEDILGFDVSDEALERAATVTDEKILTLQSSTMVVMDCGCIV